MTTLLKALAAACDGLIVPVRETGKMGVINHTSRGTIEVDERHYIICKDNIVQVKRIDNCDTYMVDDATTLYEMTKLDIFGKPLAIGSPKATILNEQKTFIEFASMATRNQYNGLFIGFIVNELMYVWHRNISVYNIDTEEERYINDESIPISLLTEVGSVILINAGEIVNYSDLDFHMLKEFGMC